MDRHISVVINTYNAEQYLCQVLEHVKRFDEIVVCDMESTDSTISIARDYGCKIVTFPRGKHRICEPARNFAIQSASHNWVLVVDADEIIPMSLMDYLYDLIEDPDFVALAIPRINRFMGTEQSERADYLIRFFRKDKTFWPPTIHSAPQVDGMIKKVPHKRELSIVHLDDPTINRWIYKMNTYTDYEVGRKATKQYGYMKLLVKPVWAFIKSYIFRCGFKHGKPGIINAYMTAIYQTILMSKVVEYQNQHK